jgi:hypothetical protein
LTQRRDRDAHPHWRDVSETTSCPGEGSLVKRSSLERHIVSQ